MIAELGILSIFYFYFIASKSLRLIRTKKTEYVALGFAMLIYFAVFCTTDFGIDASTSVFLGMILLNNRECTHKEDIREIVLVRGTSYDYNQNTI